MILGPKLVLWTRLLQQNSKEFRHPKLMHQQHLDNPFYNHYGASTKWSETMFHMILGPKLVVWTHSLRKNSKEFRHSKLMH
jgi:hypothetical protein